MVLNKRIQYLAMLCLCISFKAETLAQQTCPDETVQASNYVLGTYKTLQFQGNIGTLTTPYGTCNGLYFTSVLTDHRLRTSLRPVHPDFAVKVFPNPVVQELSIQLEGPVKTFSLQLYNALGQRVYERTAVSGTQHRIDVQGFPSGTYYLQLITSTQQTQMFKIFKTSY